MAKRSGKDAAANDDSIQPPRQKGIPGVFENVKSIPALEEAMATLADLDDAFNDAALAMDKQKDVVLSLLTQHRVPSYAIGKLVVGLKDSGPPTLYIKRLKAPKKGNEKNQAA